MCYFQAQNGPLVMNKIFWYNIIITFIYLLALFIVQNLKKFLHQIKSHGDALFLGPKWSFAPNKILFGKLLISFSSTYQPLSLGNILKKFFQWIQSYEDAQFLGSKQPISPNENFFSEKLLMSLVSFIHACLHAKNQSQILIYQ